MTTLSHTDDTLIVSNPKSWLRQRVAHCKSLVGQNKLVVPGVSPETMGGSRAEAVVKLGIKRSFHEHEAWLNACRGILPLSLTIVASALSKEWRVRQTGKPLVDALMSEEDRWVQCLGSYMQAGFDGQEAS